MSHIITERVNLGQLTFVALTFLLRQYFAKSYVVLALVWSMMEETCECWTCQELQMSEPVTIAVTLRRESEFDIAEVAAR